jgi:outer membrane protein assembly factor BamB
MRPLFALAVLTVSLAATPVFGADWPQFRGPDSTAVAPDAQIPTEPKIAWSVALPGRGLASPIVVGKKLFVTCSSGPEQERLHLFCCNPANGATIWERQLQATGRTMTQAKTSVASCTPCSDGQRVFALWSSNDLAAFDLDGNLLWLRGLTADYPNASNSLGMASSPIVIGDTLVVMLENDSESYALGIDIKTGGNLWKLDGPKSANWTSPLPWRANGKSAQAAVLQSPKGLLAVDVASGSRLWEYTEGASNMCSSVVADGVVYASSNGVTALLPQSAEPVPKQLWRSKQINPATISPVVLGDCIYSLNGAGVVSAAETKSGTIRWKLRVSGPFSGSPVAAGSRLLLVNEKGLVQVVDTTAAEGAVIGKLQLPLKENSRELVLCTPAISGHDVFLRTDSTLWRLSE